MTRLPLNGAKTHSASDVSAENIHKLRRPGYQQERGPKQISLVTRKMARATHQSSWRWSFVNISISVARLTTNHGHEALLELDICLFRRVMVWVGVHRNSMLPEPSSSGPLNVASAAKASCASYAHF